MDHLLFRECLVKNNMSKELTPEMIGLDRISPTMLQTYEDCPLNFYYQCWLGLKLEDDRMHMDFGNAVQRAIEVIYAIYDNNFGGAWEAEKGSFEDKVLYTFKQHWTKHQVPDISFKKFMSTKAGKESGFTDKSQLYKAMYDDGVAILQSYWNDKEMLLTKHDLDLEDFEIMMRVEMHNPANPSEKLPIPLSGRIDAKNRKTTKLIDFKTSKGAYNEEDSRKLMQCRAYPFAWLMKHNVFIPNFDYVVLRKGLKSPDRVQVVSLKFDEADMLAFYEQVKSILTKIANREFSRPRSGHANFCDCYKFEKLLDVSQK